MDGIETARQLQNTTGQRMPVVIMVTAHGRDEVQNAAQQRGVPLHHVLTKPVLPTTLTRAIAQALGHLTGEQTDQPQRQADYSGNMQLLGGARVLLVEDNLMNQELAVELLRAAGVTVEVAGDGQQALDKLAQDPHFDGVLMDCQMPVLDGYSTTRALRQQAAFQHLPIIAMTANAMAGDRDRAIAAGMNDHIAKPLNLGEMFSTLAKWIQPGAKAATSPCSATATMPNPSGGHWTDLPALDGVDTTAGVARTMGDAVFYRSLLCMFRDCQRDFAASFRAAQRGDDASEPERLAHTLKGSAGTICANHLFAVATELEHACASGAAAPLIESCLSATLEVLQPLLVAMEQLDAQTGPDIAAVVGDSALPDAAHTRALTGELEQLLAYGDASAADLLCNNAAALKVAYPAHFVVLREAIDAFNFDKALVLLRDAVNPST
jgi:CheY-like chemotaxis protein/HPt (histidine-containing phosphotransfer) domain-containing protein